MLDSHCQIFLLYCSIYHVFHCPCYLLPWYVYPYNESYFYIAKISYFHVERFAPFIF